MIMTIIMILNIIVIMIILIILIILIIIMIILIILIILIIIMIITSNLFSRDPTVLSKSAIAENASCVSAASLLAQYYISVIWDDQYQNPKMDNKDHLVASLQPPPDIGHGDDDNDVIIDDDEYCIQQYKRYNPPR